MPKEKRLAIEEPDEIFGYLKQSNISAKNIARLTTLAASPREETAMLAKIVLAVAKVKPHKRRRLRFLAKNHPELLRRLDETGLILAHYYY